jgi:hypothetical protein
VHPFSTNADDLLLQLENRIGGERLGHIGAALLNGWLETERGYFIRETNLGKARRGQYTISHQGGGRVAPCWELYVQLADYGWLRTIAERHGQVVRLEDRLMDITVHAGPSLVLYVENKTNKGDVDKLLPRMRRYGEEGFDLDAQDAGNDPLRKARYLVRNGRPLYLAVSATDYRQLFRVEYGEGNRFHLREDDRAFAAVLAEHPAGAGDQAPARSPVDALANEIEQACPEVWISVGSGATAYNFYAPSTAGDALILGIYENGDLWTHVAGLGPDRAGRLVAALAPLGIELDPSKAWAFWQANGTRAKLDKLNPTAVATAMRTAIGKEGA